MKSSPFSIPPTTLYSSKKPYFPSNQNSQDFTSTRPNSECFSEVTSTKSQSFGNKSSAPTFTPVPLGQHNFNIPAHNQPTETITSSGFKKRSLVTTDSRMDHPFRYGSYPVENCLAQADSPQLTVKMEETAKSALQLSKNIVASTIQAVDNAQLVVGGRNIQVELELSGLKLYDLEQKLDSCLSSSRDMLNLTSKVSPRVSEIIRLSDKKREISPIRPEFDKSPQRVSPFTVDLTSSVSKDEKERIQRLENERNNLKAIIKDATSKVVPIGQKSAGKENMNVATTTPTKRPEMILNKPRSLGRSIERLNENSSPLHPPTTTYNDSPLSKPAQTIHVESPYGLTKNSLFKEYEEKNSSTKVRQSTLEHLDVEEPEQEEAISPNFKSSCEGSTSKAKADLNEVLNIYQNRYEFQQKKSAGTIGQSGTNCSETLENTDLNVYHPKSEKKTLTRTSKADWSFNTGHDSSHDEEDVNKEIITPTLPGGAKVKPLPPLEQLNTDKKKPYLLELQIPEDSDRLRGNNGSLKDLENIQLDGMGNQAIKQEIVSFLKNFQRGETRESAKQWLKSLIDTENLSKASSPTSRTEREKFENEGESLIKTLINQTQSNLLKQTVKQNSHRTTEGSTSVSLKYTADNSTNDFEIPSHREIQSNYTSSKVSPRRNQTPRQEQTPVETDPVKKVSALVQKTQSGLSHSGDRNSTGGKRLTPRINSRSENTQNVRPPTLSRAGGSQQAAQGGKNSFAQDLGHLESLRKTVERSINYIDKSLEDFSERRSPIQETSPKSNVTPAVPNSFIKNTINNTILLKDEKSQEFEERSLDESQRRCQTEGSMVRSSATKEKEKTINTKYFVLTKNKNKNPPQTQTVNMNNTSKSGVPRKW